VRYLCAHRYFATWQNFSKDPVYVNRMERLIASSTVENPAFATLLASPTLTPRIYCKRLRYFTNTGCRI